MATIQTKILTNGFKCLMSRNGNSTVMQIFDEAGNLIKTRCKSISRTSKQILINIPDRPGIGFKPQTFKSHINDKTRIEIGFKPISEHKRYKTNVPKNKFITITKTDFNENMELANITNVQRKYNIFGKYEDTVTLKPTDKELGLIKTQEELLQRANSQYNSKLKSSQKILNDTNKTVDSLNKEIKECTQRLEEIKSLQAQNTEEIKRGICAKSYLDIVDNFWENEVAPKVKTSHYSEFATSPTIEANALVTNHLKNSFNDLSKINKLSDRTQNLINYNMTQINKITAAKIKFEESIKILKSRITDADDKLRAELCKLQRKITLVSSKQAC